MLVCEAHYEGKKHNSKVAQELEKFRQVKRKELQHHLVSKFNIRRSIWCPAAKPVPTSQSNPIQANPGEPMPKRKKAGGPTPTITNHTESFLAELASTMDLPLTPRFES